MQSNVEYKRYKQKLVYNFKLFHYNPFITINNKIKKQQPSLDHLKKQQDIYFWLLENKEMVYLLEMITYLKNTVSIQSILSYSGCEMIMRDEPDMKFFFFYFTYSMTRIFHLFHDRKMVDFLKRFL